MRYFTVTRYRITASPPARNLVFVDGRHKRSIYTSWQPLIKSQGLLPVQSIHSSSSANIIDCTTECSTRTTWLKLLFSLFRLFLTTPLSSIVRDRSLITYGSRGGEGLEKSLHTITLREGGQIPSYVIFCKSIFYIRNRAVTWFGRDHISFI